MRGPLTNHRLPSDRSRPGSPIRAGFQIEPSAEHMERASEALRMVAELGSMPGPAGAKPLRVCFSHVRHEPRLPFHLFGFHINPITTEGEFGVPFAENGELLYALVANQPVELQRETAIGFLFDLIGRLGGTAESTPSLSRKRACVKRYLAAIRLARAPSSPGARAQGDDRRLNVLGRAASRCNPARYPLALGGPAVVRWSQM